jgi:protein-tyrosine phosphatase
MASEIVPGLFVGDQQDAKVFEGDIICVLETRPADEPEHAISLPILSADGVAHPKPLNRVAAEIAARLRLDHRVLVHCGAGVERSPLAVAWYLSRYHDMRLTDAYAMVCERHPPAADRTSWLAADSPPDPEPEPEPESQPNPLPL